MANQSAGGGAYKCEATHRSPKVPNLRLLCKQGVDGGKGGRGLWGFTGLGLCRQTSGNRTAKRGSQTHQEANDLKRLGFGDGFRKYYITRICDSAPRIGNRK